MVGIPLAAPGFYVVELASPRLGAALLGARKPYYVRTATLVTNLGVHFKLGRESSLVWVTRLADGKPVANAQVDVRDCARHARTGRAAATPPASRASPRRCPRATRCRTAAPTERREYFVTARVGRRLRVRVLRLGRGHQPVALQRADRQLERPVSSRTPCSTARWCAPARRCR